MQKEKKPSRLRAVDSLVFLETNSSFTRIGAKQEKVGKLSEPSRDSPKFRHYDTDYSHTGDICDSYRSCSFE
jgi:hypothetical protein